MFPLLISLNEFGQFLRILLWISVPFFVIAMLVTTWVHYRQRQKMLPGLAPAMNGLDLSADTKVLLAAMSGEGAPVNGQEADEAMGEVVGEEQEGEPWGNTTVDARENMYQGILWMKEKYEQYRDLADQRIDELKQALVRSEKKYDELLAGRAILASDAAVQQLLKEKELYIEDLQGQLQAQWQKTEELVVKLQQSSQLLLDISKELNRPVELKPAASEPPNSSAPATPEAAAPESTAPPA